jgi:hypothetical protein
MKSETRTEGVCKGCAWRGRGTLHLRVEVRCATEDPATRGFADQPIWGRATLKSQSCDPCWCEPEIHFRRDQREVGASAQVGSGCRKRCQAKGAVGFERCSTEPHTSVRRADDITGIDRGGARGASIGRCYTLCTKYLSRQSKWHTPPPPCMTCSSVTLWNVPSMML